MTMKLKIQSLIPLERRTWICSLTSTCELDNAHGNEENRIYDPFVQEYYIKLSYRSAALINCFNFPIIYKLLRLVAEQQSSVIAVEESIQVKSVISNGPIYYAARGG